MTPLKLLSDFSLEGLRETATNAIEILQCIPQNICN
jgi:hypothetical protein